MMNKNKKQLSKVREKTISEMPSINLNVNKDMEKPYDPNTIQE